MASINNVILSRLLNKKTNVPETTIRDSGVYSAKIRSLVKIFEALNESESVEEFLMSRDIICHNDSNIHNLPPNQISMNTIVVAIVTTRNRLLFFFQLSGCAHLVPANN